jgi:hypothetical protein
VSLDSAGHVVMFWMEYASDATWLGPVQVFKNDHPPMGQPVAAPQERSAASPYAKADINTKILVSDLLDMGEQATVRHVMEHNELPPRCLGISETVQGDNGWQDGRIGQNGWMEQAHGLDMKVERMSLRVFDPALAPIGGFWALPERVVKSREADSTEVVASVPSQAPVIVAKPPKKRKQPGQREEGADAVQDEKKKRTESAREKGAHDGEEEEAGLVDSKGNVTLQPGTLVAIWLGEKENPEEFQYAIGEFRSVADDANDESEESGDEGALADEGEPRVIVQWYASARGEHKAASVWRPGWKDTGDKDRPLIYQSDRPVGGRGGVTGPVLRYTQILPVGCISLHGFTLTTAGKLRAKTMHVLNNMTANETELP